MKHEIGDIKQALEMSHEERQRVAAILKYRVYGQKPDVRAWHKIYGEGG
jgi:trehalose-6-phosphate synthase